MILLDHAEGTTLTSPSSQQSDTPPEGRTTLIILERDGSLRHYPPDDRPDSAPERARVEIASERAEPTVIDKILDFTFDILGIGNLEVRVYERQS
jgi:hypothetical protein